MRTKLSGFRPVFTYASLFMLLLSTWTAAPARSGGDKEKLTADQVVAKHLTALGTPEARAAAKTMLALGTSLSAIKIGGSGTLEGSVVMASSQDRNLLSIEYNQSNYKTERVAFDGKNLTVGQTAPGLYSKIALYFKQFEMPVREGVFGGVLSTAWPLLDVAGGQVKLKYNGTKKVNGRETHVLRYEAKKSGGLVTSLYFDAETFRHVRTEYERRQSQQGTTQAGVTQAQGDALIKLVEDFGDFAPEGGLDLPHTYKIELSIQTLKERYLQDWTISLSKFVFNKVMADSEFDASGSSK